MSETTKCVTIITGSIVTIAMMIAMPDVSPMAVLAFGAITLIVARN